MPAFSLHELLTSTLVLWSAYPLIFLGFACACLFAAFKFATHAWLDDSEPEQPNLLPYEPRSFQKPAAKGFQRGTVVSMQARKRDGNEAA